MLRAEGALYKGFFRALTRNVFFAVARVVLDFAVAFVDAGFFFVQVAAGAAVFLFAAVVAVPAVSFATSLIPGQSRHIKTAATPYKVLLSRIPSRSNIGLPRALKPARPTLPL
jgi:hypothetical protein